MWNVDDVLVDVGVRYLDWLETIERQQEPKQPLVSPAEYGHWGDSTSSLEANTYWPLHRNCTTSELY